MSAISAQKQYYQWIDTAKVMGIFLVIYGHGGISDYPVRDFIYTFHMPLFFVLSGLLYKPLSPIETIKKDWHTLLVPYLILNATCLFMFIGIAFLQGNLSWLFLWKRFGAIALGLGYSTQQWIPVSSPCWFLIALFLCRLLLSLIHRHFTRTTLSALCIISVITAILMSALNIDTLIPIDSAVMAMPFVGVGYMMKSVFLRPGIIMRRARLQLLAAMAFLVISIFCCVINGPIDMDYFSHGNSWVLFYIGGACGSAFIICIANLLFNSAIDRNGGGCLRTYAVGTLPILGWNLIVIMGVKFAVRLFLPSIEIAGVVGFVVAVVCFLFFYPIIILCSKYCPAILGGRNRAVFH